MWPRRGSLGLLAARDPDPGIYPTDIPPRFAMRRLLRLIVLLAMYASASIVTGDPGTDGQADGQTDLWSLQPLQHLDPPGVNRTDWPRNGLDHFVLARLEQEGLTPVGDAGPRSLVRRVYFHLIGLPPTPAVVDDFLRDESPDRFERLVDRLLASSRFGERWGRHWLDLVRFAESSGKEFNFTYPHAWPYRNYVIDAFNADKPYDRFLHEQLAGDLLPADPATDQDEAMVATGFLSIGAKRHNNGNPGFQSDIVDDQIDVTMRAVLGLTVACARCHDHKFDPIPTQDYYALAGIFQNTELLYGTIQQKYSNHPTALIALGVNGPSMHKVAEEHEAQIKDLAGKIEAQQKELKEQEEKLKADSEGESTAPADQIDSDQGDSEEGDSEEGGAAEADESESESIEAVIERLKKEIAAQEQNQKELEESRPARPQYSFGARDMDEPANAKIAIRGNPGELGDEVQRGFLNCVGVSDAAAPNPQQSGRLELARWMTHSDNPLTARVMVNRIWHHLFGCGLVKTVDNFGSLGERPSHPQLLDWLAVRFQEDGWSVKRMIRLLVLSRTYQLAAATEPSSAEDTSAAPFQSAAATDPENRLLWRMSPRRLEAEAIRDAMLLVSGQLDLARPAGSAITNLGDKLTRDLPRAQLQPRTRYRSVYLPVVRDYLPELFDLFDFPSPSLVGGSRSTTTVPLQDSFLHHNERVISFTHEAARRLLGAGIETDEARIDEAFAMTFSRLPVDSERQAALAYLQQSRATLAELEQGEIEPDVLVWSGLFQSLFGSAEFRYVVDVD